MKRWVVLPIFIGFLVTSCTAASTNSKATKYESFDDVKTAETTKSASLEFNNEISDLKNRIEALERNFIDVRMDYISRINNLEVEIAELKEENANLQKIRKGTKIKKIARVDRRKKVAPKKKATMLASPKKIEKSYDRAIQAYKDGDFNGALTTLNNMVVGETAKALQDNIFYWRGMCQFQLNEYANSIKNFTTVIENFPKENKYYDSKLMVAISHGMMGDKSLSINELSRLLNEKIPNEVREKANKAIQEFQR